MPRASNTFVPDFIHVQDRARKNTGGLASSDTLIEQGDTPVNVADLVEYDKMDMAMRSEYPDMHSDDSDYVQLKRSEGDIVEGVSLVRPMFDSMIRKNSDY